jgi:hypothetical protein
LSSLAGQQQQMQQQQQQQQQAQAGAAYPGPQQPQGAAKRKPDGTPDAGYDPKRQQLQQQQQQQQRPPGAPPGPPGGQLPPGPPQAQQLQQLQQQQQQAQQQARLLGAAAAAQAGQRPPQPGAPGVLLASNPAALLAMRPPQLPGAGGAGTPPPAVGSPGAAALAGMPPPGSEVFNAPVVVAEQVVAARLPVARRLVPDGRGGVTQAPAPADEQGKILPRSQLDRLMRMQGLDQARRPPPFPRGPLRCCRTGLCIGWPRRRGGGTFFCGCR